jgi:hypothetical protein
MMAPVLAAVSANQIIPGTPLPRCASFLRAACPALPDRAVSTIFFWPGARPRASLPVLPASPVHSWSISPIQRSVCPAPRLAGTCSGVYAGAPGREMGSGRAAPHPHSGTLRPAVVASVSPGLSPGGRDKPGQESPWTPGRRKHTC